jgi:hypothetical protein
MKPSLALLGACLLLAGAAHAEPPRAAPPGADAAFQDFARQWMTKLRGLEEQRPRVAAGPGNLVFTYRGYADEFRTELQPTGQTGTPYVGLLHYTERVYTCPSLEASECTIAATQPVTEIFRMQGGRWTY